MKYKAGGVVAGAVALLAIGVVVGRATTDSDSDGARESTTTSTTIATTATSTADPATSVAPDEAAPSIGTPTVTSPQTATFADGVFLETFDGAPETPTPWNPPNWDVAVHSRDFATWDAFPVVDAHHGDTCSSPVSETGLATHDVDSYEGAVFQCRDHMMTSIYSEGYGLIELTPAALVDFSAGTATVSVDVSTLRTSERDWWDIWITPFDDNLQLPFPTGDPDLQGPPVNAINITMPGENLFLGTLYRDGEAIALNGEPWDNAEYDTWLVPDPARRDTFELTISPTSLTFGMPAFDGASWIDATFAELGWTQAIVQFGHHSYNPLKDCDADSMCLPDTWHWDNVRIEPAVPFTMIKADQRTVGGDTATVTFPGPSPEGGHLRFSGSGQDIELSFDEGSTWVDAQTQRHTIALDPNHVISYWTPVPAGTSTILMRGTAVDGAPHWLARDISIWAEAA